MPSLDMKLHELKTYMGSSPCPGDFDEYWARALLELDKASLAYELIKADFPLSGVECYHLYFTGVGGAKVHAKFLKPDNLTDKAPAVAMFHGYQGHSRDWYEKLPFVLGGFVVAALDVRGQAGLSEDNLVTKSSTFRGHIVRGISDESADNLAFRNIFLDTVQLVRILKSMDIVDEERIFSAGFSQGGALSLACAALSGIVKKTAAGCPFLCDYKRVWDMDIGGVPYEELRLYFKLRDPEHTTEEEFFNRLVYIDLQNHTTNIKNEVSFYTGLMDNICPPSTQFAAYNKLKAPKSIKIYPDYDHAEYPEAWQNILLWFAEK